MKKISIYCVNYNSYEYLAAFIKSVDAAASKVGGEAVVTVFVADNTEDHIRPIDANENVATVKVFAYKDGGLPAVYCIGDTFASDESWSYGSFGVGDLPAGTNDMYTELSDNPEIFKFSYERIRPVLSEKINGGILFDFGCERFGKLIFENVTGSKGFFGCL